MVLGVDIDEVIADTLHAFLAYWKDVSGQTVSYDQFRAASWDGVLPLTPEELTSTLADFYQSNHFDTIEPFPDAFDALRQIRVDHEVVAITARWGRAAEATESWIHRHFPQIFRDIEYAFNHYLDEKSVNTKRKFELCRLHGINVIVEDAPEYAEECIAAGISVLMPDRPWNREVPQSDRLRRFRTWDEVPGLLKSVYV